MEIAEQLFRGVVITSFWCFLVWTLILVIALFASNEEEVRSDWRFVVYTIAGWAGIVIAFTGYYS